MHRLALFFVLLLAPLPAAAQSWCSSGSGLNTTERAICNDAILGALDSELGRVFAQSDVSRDDQSRWLRQDRDACGSDILCIERSYRDRLAVLDRAPAPQVDPNNRPWCSASRLNTTERAICSDGLLADLDAALEAVYGRLTARDNDRSQQEWLRGERDSCGADPDCIAAAYLRRIVVLGGRLREG